MCVEGSRIWKKKVTDSKVLEYVWTGPKKCFAAVFRTDTFSGWLLQICLKFCCSLLTLAFPHFLVLFSYCFTKYTSNQHMYTVQFTSVIKKVKLHSSQVAHQAGAYPGFCSMKWLRIFLLPRGWDASPSQDYPSALSSPVPWIYTPGWRVGRHCEGKVSYPRTQHNVPDQGSNPDHSLLALELSTLTMRPRHMQKFGHFWWKNFFWPK